MGKVWVCDNYCSTIPLIAGCLFLHTSARCATSDGLLFVKDAR